MSAGPAKARKAQPAERSPRGVQRAHAAGQHGRAARLVRTVAGAGAPLPRAAQLRLDGHLGHRFADVRIHTGDFAQRTARALEANAFTVGRDIFFAAGMYAPEQPAGYARLAHEAVHTLQQRSASTAVPAAARLEAEADDAVISGSTGRLSSTGPAIQCEPTYPRRATGAAMLREAERILTMTRDPASSDETTRLWSQVGSNFGADQTAGTIARRVWTHIFLRHFTEPDPRGGVESVHPRYFYSRTYGWVDAQHFFGFIDFAEQHLAARADPDAAFAAATAQGVQIEADQQRIRDYVILGAPPAENPTIRLMQVRPPNTSLFRSPQMVAGALTGAAAIALAAATLGGTQGELFALLNARRRSKFLLDSAKSAWTYEDIVSDQLGTRFFFQHGVRINRLSPAAREPAMLAALASFFGAIGVVDDQAEVDRLAASLPMRESYEAPKTNEARERRRHPDLFQRPAEAP